MFRGQEPFQERKQFGELLARVVNNAASSVTVNSVRAAVLDLRL
jgi:hypothetical protein